VSFVTQEQLQAGLAGAFITGSNANGSWAKFDNGVLVQWKAGSRTDWSINNVYGSLYQGFVTVTFPLTFFEIPTVMPGRAQWGASASWGTLGATPTTTSFNFRAIDVMTRAAGTAVYYSWLAIGRWK
jgi:hypothetical protein